MSPRSATWLAWSGCAASLLLVSAGLVLLVAGFSEPVPDSFGFRGYQALVGPAFAIVGAVVASRRPRNVVGWLFCTEGVVAGVQLATSEYARRAFFLDPGLPLGAYSAWLSSWLWVPGVALVAIFPALLFPDGRPPSPRWRPIVLLVTVAFALMTGDAAIASGPLQNESYRVNPFGVDDAPAVFGLGFAVALLVGIPSAVVAVVVRLRRARGLERQQLKWFVYAGALLALSLVPAAATKPAQVVTVFLMASLPIAAGIAILRYRLYDIDLVINRTLVYGAVSATLAAAYVASVVLLQQLFRPLTAGTDLAIAASTLLIAALFQPVQRTQGAVDRRFYRGKYDAARTIDSFSARLRQQVDLDTLQRELLAVVRDTMEPAQASLWLREPRVR